MNIISIDIIIYIIGIFFLSEIKRRKPNFLSLCQGVNIFLPLEKQDPKKQDQLQQNNKKKKKPSKKAASYPVKIVQTTLENFARFPLFQEYQKVLFLTLLLLMHLILSLILKNLTFLPEFVRTPTALPFYISLMLLFYGLRYAWKISTHNGYYSYEFKSAIMIAIAINTIFGIINLVFRKYLLKSIEIQTIALTNHFNVLLPKYFDYQIDLQPFRVLIFILLINTILIIITIPAIMKYGNVYGQMLKEVYYEEDVEEKIQKLEKSAGEKLAEQKLKLQCQRQLKIFNIQLTVTMSLLLLWGIPFIRQQIPSQMFFYFKFCGVLLLSYINIITLKPQIEYHCANAYKYIKQFLNQPNKTEELLAQTQRKIYSYIYLFWYPVYQLMFKFVIPVLFLIMYTHKYLLTQNLQSYQSIKYNYEINPLKNKPQKINLDCSCGIIKDPVLILKQLYKCPLNDNLNVQKIGINGWYLDKINNSLTLIIEKISYYGFLTKQFMIQVIQYILWYYILTKYILTIVYIIFLRKTVVDI